MSKNSYSEVEPTDEEIAEFLDEMYPEPVYVCGMEMSQSYVLKEMDNIAFQMVGNDNMRWYQCDICNTVYKDDYAEDKAIECCQEECGECGCDLPDNNESGLCEECESIEEAEEEVEDTEE